MKTAYVRTQLNRFIAEFEDSVDRCITVQEFIDQIPEYYQRLAADPEKPLGGITLEEFVQASQLGYKYRDVPAGARKAFIEQEKWVNGRK